MSTAAPEPVLVARLRAAGCVFAEDEARLLTAAAADAVELDELVDRRVAGVPLEHLLGWAEFCGLRIRVGPGVFVPRRRSELLARQAADHAGPGAVVVDLCCGSGAVGAAVAAAVPAVELHAADIERAAVRCAAANLAGVGGRVHVGDLYAALPAELRGRVTVLVANAPYVPTEEIGLMPAEAREHEPRTALDGGADGLAVVRRVLAGAPDWLATGGAVLFEAGRPQVPAAVGAVRAAGLAPEVVTDEELGATVVVGTRR